LARAFSRRLQDLYRANEFSVALLNYEAFPYLPAIYEWLLAKRVPIVFDIDDAIFHRYDQSALLRPFLGRKIQKVAGLCRVAVAGNSYLAERLHHHDTRVIPTVVDTSLYAPKAKPQGAPLVIGWIGSPSTSAYLHGIFPVLQEIVKSGKAKLVFVGAGSSARFEGAELREWTEESEISQVQDFDIGIMPLPDDPWSRGKCGFKLVQYMACGKPVVASPVGVNSQIVTSRTGFLAEDAGAWKSALEKLIESEALRKDLGAAARERAVAEYSLQRWSWSFVRAVSDAIRF
jgi:glycosyltransferase involved in cell wall biosynthesis